MMSMATATERRAGAGPPDGGYGWIVLAACSICLFTVISSSRIGGLVFVEILEIYDASRTEASLVLVTCRMFAFLSAPVVGFLLAKYNYRVILCTGGFLMSSAMVLSSLTTSYWQLLISYGCILGIGSNFIMVSSTLVVGLYFVKRRSFAMGILYSVAGCGGFVMPILFNFLLELYRFHGAILIVGAILMHSCACGLLVRQPTWTQGMNQKQLDNESVATESGDGRHSPTSEKKRSEANGSAAPVIEIGNSRRSSKDSLESAAPEERQPFVDAHGDVYNSINVKAEPEKASLPSKLSTMGAIRRDLSIFKDGLFLLQLINRVFVMITLTNFLPLMPDFVEHEVSKGAISKQDVAFILSMSSIGDIIVRFAIGSVLDKLPWATKHSYAVFSILSGVIVLTFQFAESYTHLMIGSVLFGLVTGNCIVVQFVLEVELMGTDRARVAHGITQFCIGVTNMLAGILLGYLRDKLGSYKVCLSLMGGLGIIGGLVWVFERPLTKCLPPPSQSLPDVLQVSAEDEENRDNSV